jgi:hypothetical protein
MGFNSEFKGLINVDAIILHQPLRSVYFVADGVVKSEEDVGICGTF